MKSVFILLLMALSTFVGSSQINNSFNQGLEMQLSAEINFQEKVKIYDYSGNLLKEYILSDVVNNDIAILDYFILEESDYAFNYLGDYYYFSEVLNTIGVN
ncbi:MAG: hypothetical protein AAGC64_01885 [Bacteroidota bacterium]